MEEEVIQNIPIVRKQNDDFDIMDELEWFHHPFSYPILKISNSFLQPFSFRISSIPLNWYLSSNAPS